MSSFVFDDSVLNSKVNRSMSTISLYIARILNRFVASGFNQNPLVPIVKTRHIRRVLQNYLDPFLLSRISSPADYLSLPMRMSLQDYFAPGNKRLVDEYGLNIQNYDYPL